MFSLINLYYRYFYFILIFWLTNALEYLNQFTTLHYSRAIERILLVNRFKDSSHWNESESLPLLKKHVTKENTYTCCFDLI